MEVYDKRQQVIGDEPLGGRDVLVDLGGGEQLVDDVALEDLQRFGLFGRGIGRSVGWLVGWFVGSLVWLGVYNH